MAVQYLTDEFFGRDARVIAGDPNITFYAGPIQTFGGAPWQDSAALGDILEYDVTLTPGDYNMTVNSLKDGSGGIADLSLDGVVVDSMDFYDAGGTVFNVVDITPVTITQLHTVFRSEVVGTSSPTNFWTYYTRVLFTPI